MTRKRQVLFVQGGGAGAHDEWDDKLVDSLKRGLGGDFEVRYPHMPAEDGPDDRTWGPAILHELAALNDGAVVVGHSVGATILVRVLSDGAPKAKLGAVVLLSAPFVGAGGWPGDDLPPDLGTRLPESVPVHLFQGDSDDTVPPAHAKLYAGAIPWAEIHVLPGRDHQLGNELAEVAMVIRGLTSPVG